MHYFRNLTSKNFDTIVLKFILVETLQVGNPGPCTTLPLVLDDYKQSEKVPLV